MSSKTIGYTEVIQRLHKAWDKLKPLRMYWDEAPSNGSSLFLAEEQGVDEYLYVHSQAVDDFKESGYCYVGHDSVDVDWVVETINSVKGLNAECDYPEHSKILVWATELDSEDCKWVIEDDHVPEMKIWNDILKDNPELTPQEIFDTIKSNSTQAEADIATKH
jgi:hypothetical protein